MRQRVEDMASLFVGRNELGFGNCPAIKLVALEFWDLLVRKAPPAGWIGYFQGSIKLLLHSNIM
jgi:hypothetical protein